MSILDPKQDAAALQPVVDKAISEEEAALDRIIDRLCERLDGATIDIGGLPITLHLKPMAQ